MDALNLHLNLEVEKPEERPSSVIPFRELSRLLEDLPKLREYLHIF